MIEIDRKNMGDYGTRIEGSLSDLKRSDVTIVKSREDDLDMIRSWLTDHRTNNFRQQYLDNVCEARVLLYGKKEDLVIGQRGWDDSNPTRNIHDSWHCQNRICMTVHFKDYKEFICMTRHYVHDEVVVFVCLNDDYWDEMRKIGFYHVEMDKNGVIGFMSHGLTKQYFDKLINDKKIIDDWYWDDEADDELPPPELKLTPKEK